MIKIPNREGFEDFDLNFMEFAEELTEQLQQRFSYSAASLFFLLGMANSLVESMYEHHPGQMPPELVGLQKAIHEVGMKIGPLIAAIESGELMMPDDHGPLN